MNIPFYAKCEYGFVHRRLMYKDCFHYLLHADHQKDEHAYFLQFKAAAIVSVIEYNKEMHLHTNAILGVCDVDKHGWSMSNRIGHPEWAKNGWSNFNMYRKSIVVGEGIERYIDEY